MQALLTYEEAGQLLSIQARRVAELVRRGMIKAVNIGRQRRIAMATIVQFIETGGVSLPGGWKNCAD